jgi:hypothetical protein
MTFILFSCAQKSEQMSEMTSPSEASASSIAANTLPQPPQQDLYSNGASRIVKSAHYRFEVADVKRSNEAIEAAIKKYPSYIASSTLNLAHAFLEHKITIRVQNEYFHDLLKEIDKQAITVNFRNIQTDDVSKDFVDLESRLRTKREVEARYEEILRKKTGTIEEVLKAEQQIGALHEEIEATVQRLNYLKDQVSYSTISLEFYQTIVPNTVAKEETTTTRFMEAFVAGWSGMVNMLLVLAHVWPLMVLGLVVVVVFRFRRRIVLSKGA